jgi:muconolactone delta-isomerase
VLFFVRFDITQPANVTNSEIVGIWQREAKAALGAMEAGAVKHLWKVAGERVVFAVVDLPSPEELDRALGGLPIVREMGPGVKTTSWPIYDYATFAADLDSGVHGP